MQTRRLATISIALLGLSYCLQTNLCQASYKMAGPEETYSAPAEKINTADYPARLRGLRAILDACARTMSNAACDWQLVGPDAAVQSAGIRTVQFVWLRSALRSVFLANSLLASPRNPGRKQRALTAASGKLRDAGLRLDQELAQQHDYRKGPRDVGPERAALEKILASMPSKYRRHSSKDCVMHFYSGLIDASTQCQAARARS
jgi:hypothetical protein